MIVLSFVQKQQIPRSWSGAQLFMANRSCCLSPCSNLSPGDHGLINSRVIESEIVQTLLGRKKIIKKNNKEEEIKWKEGGDLRAKRREPCKELRHVAGVGRVVWVGRTSRAARDPGWVQGGAESMVPRKHFHQRGLASPLWNLSTKSWLLDPKLV